MICCHRFFAVQRFSEFDAEKLNYVIAATILVASKSAGECNAPQSSAKLARRLARILKSKHQKLNQSQSVNEAIAAAHYKEAEQSNLEDMLMQDQDEEDYEDEDEEEEVSKDNATEYAGKNNAQNAHL